MRFPSRRAHSHERLVTREEAVLAGRSGGPSRLGFAPAWVHHDDDNGHDDNANHDNNPNDQECNRRQHGPLAICQCAPLGRESTTSGPTGRRNGRVRGNRANQSQSQRSNIATTGPELGSEKTTHGCHDSRVRPRAFGWMENSPGARTHCIDDLVPR
jgi:hypothetical protein